MEELNESSEKLVYCLNKVNSLISEIDRFNAKIRVNNKNANILNIKKVQLNTILMQDAENLKNTFYSLIENSYSNDEEIEKAKQELDIKTNNLIDEIKKEIENMENSQNEEIFRKAQKLIYVAKWREKQREISYLEYKDNFISKITGEAKNRKLNIQKKKLESELIKKDYYEEKEKYNGETIREIAIKLNSISERDIELIDFKEKLIKVYMLDETTIDAATNIDSWNPAQMIPYGFFEKIKYYKSLNKNIEQEIINLKASLNENRLDIKESKNNIQEAGKKIANLEKINKEIRNLINGVKLE